MVQFCINIPRVSTVLGIAGSLRRHSFNRALLRMAAEIAPPAMVVRIYDDLASIPLFNEDLEAARPASVDRLLREVRSADGLLIATPEYNWGIPGVLKNAIDWLSRPSPDEVLIGKRVAIIGASGGRWGTRLAQASLRQVLTATESVVMPSPAMFVRNGEVAAEATGAQLQAVLIAFAECLAR
jgi:chromate reductase